MTGFIKQTFAQCRIDKNGVRGTKPACIFMAINSLLAIELKATLNGYPTNDFY